MLFAYQLVISAVTRESDGDARQDGGEGEDKGAKEEKNKTYQYKERIDQRNSLLQGRSI